MIRLFLCCESRGLTLLLLDQTVRSPRFDSSGASQGRRCLGSSGGSAAAPSAIEEAASESKYLPFRGIGRPRRRDRESRMRFIILVYSRVPVDGLRICTAPNPPTPPPPFHLLRESSEVEDSENPQPEQRIPTEDPVRSQGASL